MPLFFTEIFGDKLSDSYIRDIYKIFRMNLVEDPVNILEPELADLGLSSSNALDKGASFWNPTTRVGRPTDVAHESAPDHILKNYRGWRRYEHKVII